MRGDGALVAEPECNHLKRDTGLQQMEGGGVAERVRGNPALSERRTDCARAAHGDPEPETCTRTCERRAVTIGEEIMCGLKPIRATPLEEKTPSLGPKGNGTFLAALAVEVHRVAREVGEAQRGELGDPRAGVIHQGEEEAITPAVPGRAIERNEDGADLFVAEAAQEWSVETFHRHGENALPGGQKLGADVGEGEARETAHGGEAGVARAHGVAAGAFQMGEKREHVLRRDRGQRELINRTAQVVAEKAQQQAEGIAVGGDSLWAHLAMGEEVLREESLEEGRERRGVRHG